MEHFVRGRQGLLRRQNLADHGLSTLRIRRWREDRIAKGLPSELADFYDAYGLCFDCEGKGVQMVGSTEPTQEEITSWGEQPPDDLLPVFQVCPTCGGTGKAPRAQWKRCS